MAVCVSACMPVSALGAEIAGPAISGTAQENTDNKEETVSEEAIEKKDSGKIEDEITEVHTDEGTYRYLPEGFRNNYI